MSSPRQPGNDAARETTHFGFTGVPLAAKQRLVDDVFHRVAQRYDLMNDLMSGGLHRVWKDALVAQVRPPRTRPFRHLDVAGGTGDVAFRVASMGGVNTAVDVLDISADMLAEGRVRAGKRQVAHQVAFVQGNAEDLPLPADHYDAYTIAFGIRNVPRIEKALAEAYRVLKRGGRFLCLEFSAVDVPGLDAVYRAYSFNVIPMLGRLVAGDDESYRYLVESIQKFPSADLFDMMVADAGFACTSFTRLTGGIVAIHSGWKL